MRCSEPARGAPRTRRTRPSGRVRVGRRRAAAFEPDPKLLAACRAPRRHQFRAQPLDTPEYHALHTDTRPDDTAAAGHFAEHFAQLRQEDAKETIGGSAPRVSG